MATFEQPSICSVMEYQRALERKKDETSLEIDEFVMFYLQVKNIAGLAHKYPAKVLGLDQLEDNPACRRVEIGLVNPQFIPFVNLPGIMVNGLWNFCDSRGKIEQLSIGTSKATPDHVVGDGCITDYVDGFGDELDEIMAKELVYAQRLSMTS